MHIGNRVQYSEMEAPRIMHEQKFMSLVRQAAESSMPVKLIMRRTYPDYNKLTNEWVKRTHEIVYANFAYLDQNGENI